MNELLFWRRWNINAYSSVLSSTGIYIIYTKSYAVYSIWVMEYFCTAQPATTTSWYFCRTQSTATTSKISLLKQRLSKNLNCGVHLKTTGKVIFRCIYIQNIASYTTTEEQSILLQVTPNLTFTYLWTFVLHQVKE